jgi:hypothetical protein
MQYLIRDHSIKDRAMDELRGDLPAVEYCKADIWDLPGIDFTEVRLPVFFGDEAD